MHDPRGAARELEIVGHDHEGRSRLAVEREQQVRHRAPSLAIEIAGRLVREEQPRAAGERARDADPLLLAAGELRGIVIHAGSEAHPREQIAGARVRLGLRRAIGQELERHEHVLESGERRYQMKTLEHEAHALGAQRGPGVLVEVVERHAVEADTPLTGAIETGEQPEERRLAAPRGPEHGDDLAGGDVEVHAFEDGERRAPSGTAIALGEIPGDDHGMMWKGRRSERYWLAGLRAAASLLLLGNPGCDAGGSAADAGSRSGPAGAGISLEAPVPERPVVLFLGDSLSAGYGLPAEEAFPALVQAHIDAAGLDYRVVNAGVSGDTSAGGRRRLDWLLRQPIAVLVLELGANDMLRGQDLGALRENLGAIVDKTRAAYPDARILIAGMRAPRNLGRDYVEDFEKCFRELAQETGAVLIPFLLEGVATDPALNQADGIHPTAEGHRIVADTVWRTLRPML